MIIRRNRKSALRRVDEVARKSKLHVADAVFFVLIVRK